MKRLFIAAACLALAACAGSPPPAISVQSPVVVGQPAAPAQVQSPLAQLQSFTLADLQAASADAHAQVPPDQTAYQCYDFLVRTLPTLPQFTPGQTVGAVMAFQKLRDLNSGVTSAQGALKSLNLACAPLVIDTQTTINRLALIGAGGVASGGAAAPILSIIP